MRELIPSASLDEDGDVDAWRAMSNEKGVQEDDIDFSAVKSDASYSEAVIETVEKAINFADQLRTAGMQQELEARKMVKCNHMVTLEVVWHKGDHRRGGSARRRAVGRRSITEEPDETERFCLVIVVASPFSHVQAAVVDRLVQRWPAGAKLQLTWLRDDGAAVELTPTLWWDYVFAMWCTQPWVLHAHDISNLHEREGESGL
eukprot:5971445-Prymnesium_polylepis.1